MHRAGLLLALLLCTPLAYGQVSGAAGNALARAHFNDGMARAARGDMQAALVEFEAAYTLQPHYSVLYNIGQAQVALGRPADAVRTFERYLLEGGDHLSQQRRDEVQALLLETRAKLGSIKIAVDDQDTRVWLDGVELDRKSLAKPIPLATGKHSLLSSTRSGPPTVREVTVSATTTADVRIEAAPRPIPYALLKVSCSLPGVDFYLDGTRMATTPLTDALLVPLGPKDLKFSRPGYRQVARRVLASDTGAITVTCDQQVEPTLPPEIKASLAVQATPKDAEVFVDDQRFLGGALPYGQHAVRVEREGFSPSARVISLRAGSTTNYQVTLQPTAAHRQREGLVAARRRTWGYASVGSGLAFVIGGLGLLAWNGHRFDDWRGHQNSQNRDEQLRAVASIQRIDDLGFGGIVLGTGLLATGAWLLLAEPRSD